jgi:translin
MTDAPAALENTVAEIASRLDEKNAARERALSASRQIIRHAANAIRALHRNEGDAADALFAEGQAKLSALNADLRERHADIYFSGYVQDAQKELAEAHLLRALVSGGALPSPAALGVEDAPYLNGLGEAASELRRHILDLLRRGGGREQAARAEHLLDTMDAVYSQLVTVDYPDALTNGLRRTTDLVRGVLERTRGDLTLTIRQIELEAALKDKANLT